MEDDGLYTLILSNPDDSGVDIGVMPIIHYFVGNIKGSDFQNGDLSTSDIVMPWFQPHVPIPHEQSHFCYLVYKQVGVEDYSEVPGMENLAFPVEQVAEAHNLTLLTSTYFTA